jgi:TRAP-type mannitol/chloroaromatic compound transport system permease large subunit
VVSVGTLFQAALLPGILLAMLYALYAFGYAVFNPSKAPAVELGHSGGEPISRGEGLTFFLFAPIGLIVGLILAVQVGLIGSQNFQVDGFSDAGEGASLRTNVSEQCASSMIELHGQDAWDAALAEQQVIDDAGGVVQSVRLTEEEMAAAIEEKVSSAAPIGTVIAIGFTLFAIMFVLARGVSPSANRLPLIIGSIGILLGLLIDVLFVGPQTTPGATVIWMLIPIAMILYAAKVAAGILGRNDLIRVVFPPLVLIVAVLGSILGGITNPTPAAALVAN